MSRSLEPPMGPQRRGVYLLTTPRSASNMFQTMLAKQPTQNSCDWFLLTYLQILRRVGECGGWNNIPIQDKDTLNGLYQPLFENLQDNISEAQEIGKEVLIKEHVYLIHSPDYLFGKGTGTLKLRLKGDSRSTYTNPTFLPDEFLLSLQPIFQIRHPLRRFPSHLRVFRDTGVSGTHYHIHEDPSMSFRCVRDLYDWYEAQGSSFRPLIVDADDLMNDKNMVHDLCINAKLDPDAIQYEWSEVKESNPTKKRFLSTINASTGIIPTLDSKDLDLKTEAMKWSQEFGEEDSESLVRCVSDAMPDYQYLYSRRFTG